MAVELANRTASNDLTVWPSFEKMVGLFLGWRHSSGQAAAVVVGHAIFPFEKIGDGLRLDPDFHPPQAGQKKIHLRLESTGATQILLRRPNHFDRPRPVFEQTPSGRHFFGTGQSGRSQIESLT